MCIYNIKNSNNVVNDMKLSKSKFNEQIQITWNNGQEISVEVN